MEASGLLASFAALSPRVKGVSATGILSGAGTAVQGTLSGAAGAISNWGKAIGGEISWGPASPTSLPQPKGNEEEGGHFEGAAVIIENRFSRFNTHFEVLGLAFSLEKDESDEDSDEEVEERAMELSSFSPMKSEIEEYRMDLREYYQKDIENSMIEWKRDHKGGSYQDYLVDTVPENITLDKDGNCTWMDPRTERLKRTFDRVQQSHSLHVLGRPPQPDADDEFAAPEVNTTEIDDLFD
jgi:hypothetical protein